MTLMEPALQRLFSDDEEALVNFLISTYELDLFTWAIYTDIADHFHNIEIFL